MMMYYAWYYAMYDGGMSQAYQNEYVKEFED